MAPSRPSPRTAKKYQQKVVKLLVSVSLQAVWMSSPRVIGSAWLGPKKADSYRDVSIGVTYTPLTYCLVLVQRDVRIRQSKKKKPKNRDLGESASCWQDISGKYFTCLSPTSKHRLRRCFCGVRAFGGVGVYFGSSGSLNSNICGLFHASKHFPRERPRPNFRKCAKISLVLYRFYSQFYVAVSVFVACTTASLRTS